MVTRVELVELIERYAPQGLVLTRDPLFAELLLELRKLAAPSLCCSRCGDPIDPPADTPGEGCEWGVFCDGTGAHSWITRRSELEGDPDDVSATPAGPSA